MPDLPDSKVHVHPYKDAHTKKRTGKKTASRYHPIATSPYAELAVTSNFTFLTGASHPDEYISQAAALGYGAIAITDRNSLAGVVRAHVAAKDAGIPFVVGCRLELVPSLEEMPLTASGGDPEERANDEIPLMVLVYPTSRAAYGGLCRLLTLGKRRAKKGECLLTLDDLLVYHEDLLAVVMPRESWARTEIDANNYLTQSLRRLRETFDDDRLSLAISHFYGPNDEGHQQYVYLLSRKFDIPLVAVNDVYYHIHGRRALHDVMTCVRNHCTLAEAGFQLFPNGERYLKDPQEMARLFADHPEAIVRTMEIAGRAGGWTEGNKAARQRRSKAKTGFSLDQLRYEYPHETCPPGKTPMEHLIELTWQGAAERYPQGIPEKVRQQIEHEFALIEELQYAPYFLTVHDLVRFARSRGILCQGRGAAANSAVCYCLDVTAVDPDRINLLFERFVSRERDEPPDIDIDFEHERREEVIQYIYEKYGRDRAGLTAEVITYRRRSAVRDVGKALGLSLDAVDRIAKRVDHWELNPFADSEEGDVPAQLAALGFDPTDATVRHLIRLVDEIAGFPRHLSQHVGGFVMTEGLLCESVPIENAAMKDRTVIEWDKDDIEALGMLKVDVLGLGMLTCISKALDLINRHVCLTLVSIPAEDPFVYDMMCKADTVGVFQIESRAQMTMLPRLQPRCFYDLVIEVAIVRPGPIIGDMVHPYLRRRNNEEKFSYPTPVIEEVLGKTLGVPLFQEQVMALAIKAAGFTAGEAERLRRAITAWTSKDDIAKYPARFIEGMIRNGYDQEFATWCFERMKGFSQYGFPESHAASFALLVYASAWIKCYYPAAFAAALLNSQPMGFYAPAQIIRDAQDHGVAVLPVDVNFSEWDCTLEKATEPRSDVATKRNAEKPKRRNAENLTRDLDVISNFQSEISNLISETSNMEGPALRLGLRALRGLREADAKKIVETVREHGSFATPFDLWQKSGISASTLHGMALGDAFRSMGLDRQHALWEIQQLHGKALPLFDRSHEAMQQRREGGKDGEVARLQNYKITTSNLLPEIPVSHQVAADYRIIGFSLKDHPLSFLREMLTERGVLTAIEAKDEIKSPFGRRVTVAGLVLFRQRPGTARGVMFMTLEDETGRVDLIVRPSVYEKFRNAAVYSKLVLARGRIERHNGVVHVLATAFESLDHLVTGLPPQSRDFR